MNRICKCLFSIGVVLASSRVFALKDDPVCRIAERSLKDLVKTTCNTFDLEPELCKTGISYLQDEKRLEIFSRAQAGNLPVYLLSDQLVAKDFEKSFYERNTDRREKDETAFRFIEGRFNRLKVPASCLYGFYSINERLPIMNSEHAGSVYYLHPDAFTEAVEEFTLFFMEHSIGDMTGFRECMPPDRPNSPRFDNIVPYLVKEGDRWVGYIGLVDLEHLEKGTKPSADMIEELILLFPYHFSHIVRLVQDSFPGVSFKEKKEIPRLYLAGCVKAPNILQQYGNNEKFLQERGDFFFACLVQAARQESLDDLDRLLVLPNTSLEAKEGAFLEMVRRGYVKGIEKLLKSREIGSQIQGKALLEALKSSRIFKAQDSIQKLLKFGEIDPQIKVEAFIQTVASGYMGLFTLDQTHSLLQYIEEEHLLQTREELQIAVFIHAAEEGNEEKFTNLFDLSTELKDKILIIAAEIGYRRTCTKLLEIGGISPRAQKAAFMRAARRGSAEVISKLLESGEISEETRREAKIQAAVYGYFNLPI
jgi:hypothetical protein